MITGFRDFQSPLFITLGMLSCTTGLWRPLKDQSTIETETSTMGEQEEFGAQKTGLQSDCCG